MPIESRAQQRWAYWAAEHARGKEKAAAQDFVASGPRGGSFKALPQKVAGGYSFGRLGGYSPATMAGGSGGNPLGGLGGSGLSPGFSPVFAQLLGHLIQQQHGHGAHQPMRPMAGRYAANASLGVNGVNSTDAP